MKFYAGCGQDVFAHEILGQEHGFFVDYGAQVPVRYNNTYAFEQIGWDGLSFEVEKQYQIEWERERRTPCIYGDVTVLPIKELFEQYQVPSVIDYLTIDVDQSTLRAIMRFPFDSYSFKVLTIEHDHYKRPNVRGPLREFLLDLGYKLERPDIETHQGEPFEDWWIHPDIEK